MLTLLLSLNIAMCSGPSLSVTMTGLRVIISPPPLGKILALATISNTLVLPALWSPTTTTCKCEERKKRGKEEREREKGMRDSSFTEPLTPITKVTAHLRQGIDKSIFSTRLGFKISQKVQHISVHFNQRLLYKDNQWSATITIELMHSYTYTLTY